MIAKRVIAKVTAQNIYNTEQGVYEAAASVNNDGELMVTFKPRTPPDAEWPKFIIVRYTQQETAIIRRALAGGPPC